MLGPDGLFVLGGAGGIRGNEGVTENAQAVRAAVINKPLIRTETAMNPPRGVKKGSGSC